MRHTQTANKPAGATTAKRCDQPQAICERNADLHHAHLHIFRPHMTEMQICIMHICTYLNG